MTIRSRRTRGDWWPAGRIPGLKRYAFIGDSTMYGAGVGPDETLPARAERLLNEAVPGWPVEAVNYGVSGYNIWNSWRGIKPVLPLFDGLVLALCNNDAEMFSGTFGLRIPDGVYASWQPDDPFGAAAGACFAEIGQVCAALGVPVMVMFCNAHDTPRQIQVHDIIAGHCAANGLGYIHTMPIFKARNLPIAELVVSAADGHPSALAHDLAARHMVSEMTRLGWFRAANETPAAAAPARIEQAAGIMMAAEAYPDDAALSWALGALEAKSRTAKRRAALAGEDDFEPAAAPVRAALAARSHAWHVARRAEACGIELALRHQGVAGDLVALQAARLRLEEIGYALSVPEGAAALARLSAPPDMPAGAVLPDAPPEFLQECRAGLAAEAVALGRLRELSDEAAAAMAPLERQLALLADEVLALERAVGEVMDLLRGRSASLPPPQAEMMAAVLQAEFELIRRRLRGAGAAAGWQARLGPEAAASSTEVQIVLRTGAVESGAAMFSVRTEYLVPHRVPFMRNFMFHTTEQPVVMRFKMPLLYAGRVTLCNFAKPGPHRPEVLEILEVTVCNDPGQKRSVPVDRLYRDEEGNWVSPPLVLV
jgi:hypothetical protein